MHKKQESIQELLNEANYLNEDFYIDQSSITISAKDKTP